MHSGLVDSLTEGRAGEILSHDHRGEANEHRRQIRMPRSKEGNNLFKRKHCKRTGLGASLDHLVEACIGAVLAPLRPEAGHLMSLDAEDELQTLERRASQPPTKAQS
jgi:hypothetical protein